MGAAGGETRNIVVIGASAGAVPALQRLVAGLPPHFPGSIFVTVHLWPHAESFLPDILSRAGPLPAEHARHGTPIERGRIYVAPNDHHLLLDDGRVFLSQGPRENRFRPAINPLFRSAAVAHGPSVVGVILTGMLDDGVAGLWAVKHSGGVAIVQSDAQFSEMPRQAARDVKVDHDIPLAEIAPLLVKLGHESIPATAPVPVPEIVRLSDEKSKMRSFQVDMDRVGRRSFFSCPECSGALWEVPEGGQLGFACHVGHTYTPKGLLEAQGVSIEQSLWSAERALKESAAMHERLAAQARENGLPAAAELYQSTADLRHAEASRVHGLIAVRSVSPGSRDDSGSA